MPLGSSTATGHTDTHPSRRGRAALVAACAIAGCLPAGPPPVGQQLISDRTLMFVNFSPSETEGVPSHVLVTGPADSSVSWYSTTYSVAPLYLVPEPSAAGPVGGLASAKLLASRSTYDFAPFPTDSLGRLLGRFYSPSASSPLFEIERVNLQTGIQEYLGLVPSDPSQPTITLSPGRTRLIVGGNGDFTVYDLDRAGTYFSTSWAHPTFVGEDLYLSLYSTILSGDTPFVVADLFRLKAYGQLEKVFASAALVSAFPTAQGTRLLLNVATELAPLTTSYVLLDPETLQATPFLSGGDETVLSAGWAPASPDGQWLPVVLLPASVPPDQSADAWSLGFVNLTTNEIRTTGFSLGSVYGPVGGQWRPGHDEFWFAAYDGTLRVWKPDSRVTSFSALPFAYYQSPSGQKSFFTPDGNHWFSSSATDGSAVFVGSADAPEGPVYGVNPSGTDTYSYWPLSDGRLLVGVEIPHVWLGDYFIVDPATGASQAFANSVFVVAVGNNRALVLFNWELQSGSGDLTLVDLETSHQIVLAEGVYSVAVDPGISAAVPPGSDALAPGTRVAYLLRNRIASPYDGLWIAELP